MLLNNPNFSKNFLFLLFWFLVIQRKTSSSSILFKKTLSQLNKEASVEGIRKYIQLVADPVSWANPLLTVNPVGWNSTKFSDFLQMRGVTGVPSSNNQNKVNFLLHQLIHSILSFLRYQMDGYKSIQNMSKQVYIYILKKHCQKPKIEQIKSTMIHLTLV